MTDQSGEHRGALASERACDRRAGGIPSRGLGVASRGLGLAAYAHAFSAASRSATGIWLMSMIGRTSIEP
jgi:hypothetical protein